VKALIPGPRGTPKLLDAGGDMKRGGGDAANCGNGAMGDVMSSRRGPRKSLTESLDPNISCEPNRATDVCETPCEVEGLEGAG